MSETLRQVSLERIESGKFRVTNARGATIDLGSGGSDDFTPVELLLAALAGCAAVDLELITAKRAEPTLLTATSSGHKVRDELGNRLTDLQVAFALAFDGDPGVPGDAAWEVVPRTLEQINQRLCTVGRTVIVGTPVALSATLVA